MSCAHSRRSIGYEKDPRRRSVGILDEHPFSSSHCVWVLLDVWSGWRSRNMGDFSSSENRRVSSRSRHAVSAESSPLHEIGNFPHGHVPGQSLHPEVPVLREQNHLPSQTPRLTLLCRGKSRDFPIFFIELNVGPPATNSFIPVSKVFDKFKLAKYCV